MRSLLSFSSRSSRRLALIALVALAATVVNGVPAKADAATHLALQGVNSSLTAVRDTDSITVVAQDQNNATDATYAAIPHTVTFSADCGDCFTISPNDGAGNEKKFTFNAFAAPSGDEGGSMVFSLVWKESAAVVGTRTLTVSAPGLSPDGTASGITVLSNAPEKLDLTGVQTGAVQNQQEVFGVQFLNPQDQTNPND